MLFGGMVFIMRYGCVIWGMVFIMRYGCVIWGYGLHYEVWLCYLGGMFFIMRYGCAIAGGWLCNLGLWSSFWGTAMLFWVIARPSLGLGRHG